MRFIALMVFVAIIVAGCQKETEHFKITGTLYYGCDRTPVPNTEVVLRYTTRELFTEDEGIAAETTTDANGNFAFTYEQLPEKTDLSIDPKQALIHIPANKNLDVGDVLLNAMGTVELFLDAKQGYTSSDTLFIGVDGVSSQPYDEYYNLAIPGPFTSGKIGSEDVYFHLLIGGKAYSYDEAISAVKYSLNRYDSDALENWTQFYVKSCDTVQVTLTLD